MKGAIKSIALVMVGLGGLGVLLSLAPNNELVKRIRFGLGG
jgi:hypothetical protein